MEKTSVVVRRALKSKQISERAAFEIERRGAEAFREIAKILAEEPLSDLGKVNALRLMAQVTRQSYTEGKPELVRLAARLVRDPSERVRSVACDAAILNLSLLEQLTHLKQHATSVEDVVRGAVFAALDRGIDAWTRGLAERTIEQRGWRR